MQKQKGFTLIELLVVIAIIGLLSTLAVVALTSARAKARDAKRISDVKQIQTALELFFADGGQKYPAQTAAVALGQGALSALCSDAAAGFATGPCTKTTFMGKVPRDPSGPATPAACISTSGAACDYGYISKSSDATYELWFRLEGPSGELIAGMNCASPNGMKATTCP